MRVILYEGCVEGGSGKKKVDGVDNKNFLVCFLCCLMIVIDVWESGCKIVKSGIVTL